MIVEACGESDVRRSVGLRCTDVFVGLRSSLDTRSSSDAIASNDNRWSLNIWPSRSSSSSRILYPLMSLGAKEDGLAKNIVGRTRAA